MEIGPTAGDHGVSDDSIRHAVEHAIAGTRDDDDNVVIIGPDEGGSLLEVIGAERSDGLRLPRHADAKEVEASTAMTSAKPAATGKGKRNPKPSAPRDKPVKTATAGKTYGRTKRGEAITPDWIARQGSKIESDDYIDRVLAGTKKHPQRRLAPEEIRVIARGRGHPPLGEGPSVQVRVRLDPATASDLELAVKTSGQSRSEIIRNAIAAYLKAS